MKIFLVIGFAPYMGMHKWIDYMMFFKKIIISEKAEDIKAKVLPILPEKNKAVLEALWDQEEKPECCYYEFSVMELGEFPGQDIFELPIFSNGNSIAINTNTGKAFKFAA